MFLTSMLAIIPQPIKHYKPCWLVQTTNTGYICNRGAFETAAAALHSETTAKVHTCKQQPLSTRRCKILASPGEVHFICACNWHCRVTGLKEHHLVPEALFHLPQKRFEDNGLRFGRQRSCVLCQC